MKKLATTQLLNKNEEIYINEYENGTYTKVIDGIETESNIDELQELVNNGDYEVIELTF